MLFTTQDLNLIKQVAGELQAVTDREMDVYERLNAMPSGTFSTTQMKIITFCAQECERQVSGPLSVSWMLTAYNHAYNNWGIERRPTAEDFRILYCMLEPHKNPYGFRSMPVIVNGELIPVDDFDFRINQWLSLFYEGYWDDPDYPEGGIKAEFEGKLDAVLRFYVKFEKTHAGNDGNGRAGAIGYNFLKGTMLEPVAAPNVFKPKPQSTML